MHTLKRSSTDVALALLDAKVDPLSRLIEEGRKAFEDRAWARAREALSEAREADSLEPDDLWRLALSSFLLGRSDDFVGCVQALHHAQRDRGEVRAAARSAIWLGIHLDSQGEVAQAAGWFGRAERLLDREGLDCSERGFLCLPRARQHLMSGDTEGALRLAAEAAAAGQRFDDPELLALALFIEGRVLLRAGRILRGLARLDEAMISVAADELSPQVTGLVYCGVVGACRDVWAFGRMREWTARLAHWCETQGDMVAYTGQCRAYRAEILLREGRWHQAVRESRNAAESAARGSVPAAAGLACYLEAEVHRLRGDYGVAEAAYRAASAAGYEPQPGLTLLRLGQGAADAARATLERALAETGDPSRRARLLTANIDVSLELGDADAAERACDELADIRRSCGSDVLGTILAQSRGAVALARDRPSEALGYLRTAWAEWRDLEAPWDAARARVLLGLACRALGDEEGATLELGAARGEFERLGAVPDMVRVDGLARRGPRRDTHGLTPREREVLAQVATGATNRAVAEALFISERTVARHAANIFAKLGVSSRAAATAYAYQHDLLEG